MYWNQKVFFEPLTRKDDVYFVLLNSDVIAQRHKLPAIPTVKDLSRFYIMGTSSLNGVVKYNEKTKYAEIRWANMDDDFDIGGFIGVSVASQEVLVFDFLASSLRCYKGGDVFYNLSISDF